MDYSHDPVLLIDVLEHFNKSEGKMLLTKRLANNNKGVLISTPKNPSNQKFAKLAGILTMASIVKPSHEPEHKL